MIKAGFIGYKAPSLKEAYNFIFNADFDNAHDALSDVNACFEIFKELNLNNKLGD